MTALAIRAKLLGRRSHTPPARQAVGVGKCCIEQLANNYCMSGNLNQEAWSEKWDRGFESGLLQWRVGRTRFAQNHGWAGCLVNPLE